MRPGPRALLSVIVLAAAIRAGELEHDVHVLAAAGRFQEAATRVDSFEKQHGQTPESILSLSWIARSALVRKQYELANEYAEKTYKKVENELSKRPLDREPDLPLALGASIEVQSQVMATKGQRGAAVEMLEDELKKYSTTSIHARIQKDINLLSLEGKPAAAIEGGTLPKGKPTFLFFWAHWCPDCRAEAPLLAHLKREYGPRGLVVMGATQKYGYIGADSDVPAKVELAYIEKIRHTYFDEVLSGPTIVNEQNFLTYGVSTTPTLVLIDQKSIVRLYHPGAMKYPELKMAVERVLSGR
jgi:thiol-disulfide isomerase/thioredoxin